MRNLRLLTFQLMLMLANLLAAQKQPHVLPAPVISSEPATVRLVFKNVDAIGGKKQTFISNRINETGRLTRSTTGDPKFTDEGSTHVYELQIQDGRTSGKCIRCLDYPELAHDGVLQMILIPGKTTTCTIDCKKNTYTFSGPFAQLDAELTKYRYPGSKYFPFTVLCVEWKEMDYYKDICRMTGDEIAPQQKKDIIDRYLDLKKEVMTSRKFSPEFKELWLTYAGVDIYSLPFVANRGDNNDYTIFYTMRGCSKELFPFETNACFYTDKLISLRDICDQYNREKIPYELNENVRHLLLMQDVVSQNKAETMTTSKLNTIKEIAPEYYDGLVNYYKWKRNARQWWEDCPKWGNLCEIDRQLEDDELVSCLLEKYKGKPTIFIVNQTHYLPSSLFSDEQYEGAVNFVHLMSSSTYDENKVNECLRTSPGEVYVLFDSQINYFVSKFTSQIKAQNPDTPIRTYGSMFCVCLDEQSNMKFAHNYAELLYPYYKYPSFESFSYLVKEMLSEQDNFVINGVVSQGIEDCAYKTKVFSNTRAMLGLIDFGETKVEDKKFSYRTHVPEACSMSLCAMFPDGSQCSHHMAFPAVPGDTCNIKVMNGQFFLSGTGFYSEWQNAEDLVTNARNYHTEAETDSMIQAYLKDHGSEPGCILFYIYEKVLPLSEIKDVVSPALYDGKFGGLLCSKLKTKE